jgi:hypothetical protein
VTSVYAKAGKDRIRYRVVDEYNSDTLSEKRTRSSKRPLSLGELIDFLLGAWPLQEVHEMNELDRDGARDFTRPSSEVYPQFAAGYGRGLMSGMRSERRANLVRLQTVRNSGATSLGPMAFVRLAGQ